MKHLTLFAAGLLIICMLHAQGSRVKLSDSVSISAPVALRDTILNNIKVKMGGKEDHVTSFTAMMLDYSAYGLTEAMLSSMAGTEDFRSQFKTGILNSMAGSTMLSDTMAKYHNKYVYYDFVISMNQNSTPITMYIRSLFYKGFGINLYYTLPKSYTGTLAERDRFFNSIEIIE